MSNRPNVLVMGAGPAGLATGYALSQAGWAVQVYDQGDQVGGLARTIRKDGFGFDIGGHRWYTKKDELNYFLMDLLGDELIDVDRRSSIYFDGSFVDYPLRVGDTLTKIGPLTSARALGDFAISRVTEIVKPRPARSMEDAYIAQFGRTLYELFFRRYSEKVWGERCDQLSGDWVTQRSRGLSLSTTVRNALKKAEKVESLVDRFMYPRDGYGRISEKMAEHIENAGGSVNLGWRVLEVFHDGRTVNSVRISNGRTERIVEADSFVSTIPLPELAQSLRPGPGQGVLDAAASLSYRALITVHVTVDAPQVTNQTWIYVQDPSVTLARLHEPRNWSPDLAPPGKSSLVLEIFCEERDQLWEESDEVICDMVIADLEQKLKFLARRDVMDAFVIRSRDAYPRYSLDYRPAVETLKDHVRQFSNLVIVGRGGTFRYNNTDHAIETGLLGARALLGEAADPDQVNRDAEYLEERIKAERSGALNGRAQPVDA
jgi:protoporphyrinogen oxidase